MIVYVGETEFYRSTLGISYELGSRLRRIRVLVADAEMKDGRPLFCSRSNRSNGTKRRSKATDWPLKRPGREWVHMSEKDGYPLSRAIASVLARGVPSRLEADYHFAELQAREPGLPLAQLAAARHAGSMVVHVPLWARARNVVSQPYRPPGWPSAVSTSGGNLVGETEIHLAAHSAATAALEREQHRKERIQNADCESDPDGSINALTEENSICN